MRTLSFLFLLLLSLASCKKNSANADATAPETTTVTTAADVKEATGITNDDINQYIASYDNLLKDYKAALESKNMEALNTLTTKFTELSEQGNKAVAAATGENQQKLIQVIKEKSEEFTALSQAAVK